jgi:hypothetical protein
MSFPRQSRSPRSPCDRASAPGFEPRDATREQAERAGVCQACNAPVPPFSEVRSVRFLTEEGRSAFGQFPNGRPGTRLGTSPGGYVLWTFEAFSQGHDLAVDAVLSREKATVTSPGRLGGLDRSTRVAAS